MELEDVICEKWVTGWLVPEITNGLHVVALANRWVHRSAKSYM